MLKDYQVRVIRKSPLSLSFLAEKYNTTKSNIGKIKRGESYKNVE
jgi:hypothetical protein